MPEQRQESNLSPVNLSRHSILPAMDICSNNEAIVRFQRMKTRWMLVLLIFVFAVPLVSAQDHLWGGTGNEFLAGCGDMPDSSPTSPTAPPEFDWGRCQGYVIGIDDGVQLAYDIVGQPQPYCVPSEVTTGQLIRVLIKFIKDHPEKAHSKTKVLEVEAFINAFPCKQPSKK
jgi:hypothetical protein